MTLFSYISYYTVKISKEEATKNEPLTLGKQMTNVSTKYINDYVGFFTYIRNWKVDNGHYPTSKKDAEKIFIEMLKTKVNYTINDLNNAEIDLPKPSSKYISILNEETAKARKATSNKYFKFNPEDGLGEKTFNKRDYLLDQPKSKLYQICKDNSLKKYRQLALYSLVSLILKLPDIDEIIYNLVINDRNYKIDEEDKKYIDSRKFGSI